METQGDVVGEDHSISLPGQVKRLRIDRRQTDARVGGGKRHQPNPHDQDKRKHAIHQLGRCGRAHREGGWTLPSRPTRPGSGERHGTGKKDLKDALSGRSVTTSSWVAATVAMQHGIDDCGQCASSRSLVSWARSPLNSH
jgi:hypothetical protein